MQAPRSEDSHLGHQNVEAVILEHTHILVMGYNPRT